MISWIVLGLYFVSLLYLFLFSLGQLHLTWIYTKVKNEPQQFTFTPKPVTIQLPIYNEQYVAERLLDAVAKIDYPKEHLQIQILDDSTDETSAIVLRKVESLRPLNLNITVVHREHRLGYKAGALEHGLALASGEFIAIFDADFIPTPDFLKKTLPYFEDESVGVVQTRWGHLNRDYSILTQLQAFGLDAHFSVEQCARNSSGSFINFNGTCGVWRKKCITDAGGWSYDTLTEDLDLSYRAQLKGWKFKYLEEVVTPGELPVIMPAIKSQQYRWNKGGAETARKIFGKVLLSSVGAQKKIHAFFHLFNSSVFAFLLVGGILSIPALYIKASHPELKWIFNAGIIFVTGFLSIAWLYWTSSKKYYDHPGKTFFQLFPRFLIVSMGLSFHNGLAVIEGLLGRRTPFVRTPKFNIQTKNDPWLGNVYLNLQLSAGTITEGVLCLYFIFGIVLGFYLRDFGLLFFHLMMALGFGFVFYYSVKPAWHA